MVGGVFKAIGAHLRAKVVAGLLLIIPIVVTYLVLRLLFNFIVDLTDPLFTLPFFDPLPRASVSWVGVITVVVILYLAGVIATDVVGRRFVELGHRMVELIPMVRVIYRTAKQATEILSGTNSGTKYSQVVILDYPRLGVKSIGLVTARLKAADGQPVLAVYVPTTPNPTSGYLAIVPESQVTRTDIPVEEAMKIVISGGILSPESLGASAMREDPPPENGPSKS